MRKLALRRRHGLAIAAGAALFAPSLVHVARAAQMGDIVLGGVFALTGPVRLITEPYEQGARSYFNKVNKDGGIGGRQIKWLVEDDAYQPAKSLAGAKKLVERDEVAFLFGQMGTPTTAAIATYAEQARVPFFSASPVTKPPRTFTFGFMASYPDEMHELVTYLIQKRGLKRIAYLYQNDDLGEVARTGVASALQENGVDLIGEVGYERGTSDFATQVLKLRDSKPEAVISIGTAPTIASGIKQSHAMGFTPIWGTYGVGCSNIMQSLLGADINGLLFATEVLDQFSDTPDAQQVKAELKISFPNAKADYATMLGYGHARMIVDVLKTVGTDVTRERVMDVVESDKSFPVGIMQPIRYGKTSRSGASAIRIFEWRGGVPQPQTDWVQINT